MRELVHEFICELDSQLKSRFKTAVRNVNLEDRTRLISPFDVFDRFSHAEQVESPRCIVLLINLSSSHYTYGEGNRIDTVIDDPLANFLRKHIKSVRVDQEVASTSMFSSHYSLEIPISGDIEKEIKELIKFFKDPEYYGYSKDFDKEMDKLLARDEDGGN